MEEERPARAYLEGLNGVAFVVTCAILTPILASTIPLLFLIPIGLHRVSEPGFWAEMLQMLLTVGGTLSLTGFVPGAVAVFVLVRRLWRGSRLYYAAVAWCAALCAATAFPLTMMMIQFSACFGSTSGICPMTDAKGWLAPLLSILTLMVTVPSALGSATLLWWAWGAIFGRSLEGPVATGPIPVPLGSDVSAR